MDILIIGGTGYLGSNFSLLCKDIKIPHTILDLRHVKDNNLEEFDVVIDFSMINRRVVTWLKDDIEMFKHNHNLLLDKILGII